jgi:hypothetical protein
VSRIIRIALLSVLVLIGSGVLVSEWITRQSAANLNVISSGTVVVLEPTMEPIAGWTTQSPSLTPSPSPVPTPSPAPMPSATPSPIASATATPTASPSPSPTPSPTPKPLATPHLAPTPTPRPTTTPRPPATYTGVNHVWVPALNISQKVYTGSCHAGGEAWQVLIYPCTGTNDLLLEGSASTVFKPLSVYYLNHKTLPKGMDLYEADSHGKVSHYRMISYKVVVFESDAEWSLVDENLSVPTVTLMTCLNNPLNLVVRFAIVR